MGEREYPVVCKTVCIARREERREGEKEYVRGGVKYVESDVMCVWVHSTFPPPPHYQNNGRVGCKSPPASKGRMPRTTKICTRHEPTKA